MAGGGGCQCVFAGAGGGTDSNDYHTYGCACVLYGQGGDGHLNDRNRICGAAGEGYDDTQYDHE